MTVRIHLHNLRFGNMEERTKKILHVPHGKVKEVLACLLVSALRRAKEILDEGKLPVYIEVSEEAIERYKSRPAKRQFTVIVKYLDSGFSSSDVAEARTNIERVLGSLPDNIVCATTWLSLIADQFKGVVGTLPNPWK